MSNIAEKIEHWWVWWMDQSDCLDPIPCIVGYFTPKDCFTLVNEGLASYMQPWHAEWVESSLMINKSQEDNRWVSLKLTEAGQKIFCQPG